MSEIRGDKLFVELSASQVRRMLKGHGFGVRKVFSGGRGKAVIIHTATGDHLRELRSLFQDRIIEPPEPGPDEEGQHS